KKIYNQCLKFNILKNKMEIFNFKPFQRPANKGLKFNWFSSPYKFVINNHKFFHPLIWFYNFHIYMNGFEPSCFTSFKRFCCNQQLWTMTNGKHGLFNIHEVFSKCYKSIIRSKLIR